MMFLCDVWKLCDWYCDDVFVWRVKFLWLILWWCFCVTCESLCDWYCDDVFVWRVKFLWLIYCVMCESFATDIVTMSLCDMWRFCDVVILSVWRVKVLWIGDIVTMFLGDVWRFCDVVILWRCFWVKCEDFVFDIVSMFLCDVWKICDWYRYCDDAFVRVKVLCNAWSSVTIFFLD